MLKEKQVAELLRQELGRPIVWCHKLIDDFKGFTFPSARIIGITPMAMLFALARQVIAQEQRDKGPDLDGEDQSWRASRTITLPPSQYTTEDVKMLSSV